MKICFIGQKFVPSREGGIEVVVENLASRMASAGNDVTIFNRRRKYQKLTIYKGCKIKNVFTINTKKLDTLVYSFNSTIISKKMKFEIIHFHAEGSCAFLGLFGKKGRKNRSKIVVTIHGLDWKRAKWGGFAKKFLLFCESQIVKYADQIIVLSKGDQDYFENTYHVKAELIPNGIDNPVKKEPNIIKKKWGLDFNGYVLFLARIVPEKGLHYLISAWKEMNLTEKGGKKLVIAGGSSHSDVYFDEIKRIAKEDSTIIFTDFVYGPCLEEIFSNAFLYVLPSDIEGMPMPLLEAKSYGLKCLVSDISENTAIIDKDDFTFKHGDYLELERELKTILLSYDNYERYGRILYSWDYVTEKTLSVYKELRK